MRPALIIAEQAKLVLRVIKIESKSDHLGLPATKSLPAFIAGMTR
jgi:hypothetical protein